MLNYIEYKKKKSEIKKKKELNSLSNLDMSNSLLVSYLNFYSKKVFLDLFETNILTLKKEILGFLKNDTWLFEGLYDYGTRGFVSSFTGHKLRYVYKLVHTDLHSELYLGLSEIENYFTITSMDISKLHRLRKLVYSDFYFMDSLLYHNLLDEYSHYDYALLGVLWSNFGKDGITSVFGNSTECDFILAFMDSNLPLPSYLLNFSLSYIDEIKNYMLNINNWNIDVENLDALKCSEISMISNIFTFSEGDIKSSFISYLDFKVGTSDFYSFLSISDLSVGISIWKNRNINLLKIHNYFKSIYKDLNWFSLYRYVIEKECLKKRENMYSLELLSLFDLNISLDFSIHCPHNYRYKGHILNKNIEDMFDSLLSYMSSREFFQFVQEYYTLECNKKEELLLESELLSQKLDYMYSNINKDKYNDIKGIGGVRDILLYKKIPYSKMTIKQRNYVNGIYDLMCERDKLLSTPLDSSSLNNHYSLMERPDVLIKIERIQQEVFDKLSDFYKGIIISVLSNKIVTDRQLNQIEKIYNKYILETPLDNVESLVPLSSSLKNRKYSLIERPDISEKIKLIKSSPEYFNIPLTVRGIFDNILKYGMVSEKQAQTVETTYKRHIGL